MSYLQDADRWLDALLDELLDGKKSTDEVNRAIRAKLLESYRNGQTAGASPAPRESRPPRRFAERGQR